MRVCSSFSGMVGSSERNGEMFSRNFIFLEISNHCIFGRGFQVSVNLLELQHFEFLAALMHFWDLFLCTIVTMSISFKSFEYVKLVSLSLTFEN